MKVGVIGGTGFYQLLDRIKEETVNTEYGEVTVFSGEHRGREVFFLPRHGKGHRTLAPYVNYKANMMALKELEIDDVLAVSAVGAINPEIRVGDLCLLEQFVDWTTREKSYGRISVDITDPFCPHLRDCFKQAAKAIDEPLRDHTTLICVEGPRYETREEVKLFASWGMDVVGMTNATEASLARELGLSYAVVVYATNMAPGVTDTPPSLEAHKKAVDMKRDTIKRLILETISLIDDTRIRPAKEAYERAVLARDRK